MASILRWCRRNWKTTACLAYATAEAVSYWKFCSVKRSLEAPSSCSHRSTNKYRDWIRSSVMIEPDLGALVRGAFFNSCELGDIPRRAVIQFASHLLFFRRVDELDTQQEESEVIGLVNAMESQLGMRFPEQGADIAVHHRRVSSFPTLSALGSRAGMPEVGLGFRPAMTRRDSFSGRRDFMMMRQSFLQAPVENLQHAVLRSPRAGRDTTAPQAPEIEASGFDGINKFGDPPLAPFYKPLWARLLLSAYRSHWQHSFVAPPASGGAGFELFATRSGLRFYVHRGRDGPHAPYDGPPLLFIHGFGLGLLPYSALLERLVADAAALGQNRMVVALELPNISHGETWDGGGVLPAPPQLTKEVEAVMRELAEQAVQAVQAATVAVATESGGGRGAAVGGGAVAVSGGGGSSSGGVVISPAAVTEEAAAAAMATAEPAVVVEPKFVLMAHSYGTCVSAYLIHQRPSMLERVILIDPICFQSGFHKIGLYPFTTLKNVATACEELGYSAARTVNEIFLWWFVSKDLYVQAVCKRHMWGPEFWLRGDQLNANSLVVLGGNDTVVAANTLHEVICEHMPTANVRIEPKHAHTDWLNDEVMLQEMSAFAFSGFVPETCS